eukprot:TRINITY_DN77030_c0_g1_i1.p1 TRINITY_DN77030_c0_g1~~TRINITY_DN77030_c0_g1_i1.p1  ORF type:complete len:426 (+),score=54.79 TRINITY_DN77030_c0_g1_i1:62-1339(+)
MKFLKKEVDTHGMGCVALMPEDEEDIWHLYNLIMIGDNVKCKTLRKVQHESSSGLSSASKIQITVKLRVEKIDYDAGDVQLRVKGVNIQESEHLKMGQYHTVELEPLRNVTIYKEKWDSISLERVDESCDATSRADLAAIVMQEGLANICLITSTMTLVKQRIEMNIPRKRKGASGHEKGIQKFYETVGAAIQRIIRWDVVKCVLCCSPAFVKDDFFQYLMAEAQRTENKPLLENKGKWVFAHSSSGHKHCLKEVLSDRSLASKLCDTKATEESKALDDFYEMLQNEPDRAMYGPRHVAKAVDHDAVEVLMISDGLFRNPDFKIRSQYVELVERARETSGTVFIFSALHVTGEQLTQLSGIAAILRFPCPEINEEALREEEEEQRKQAAEEEAQAKRMEAEAKRKAEKAKNAPAGVNPDVDDGSF